MTFIGLIVNKGGVPPGLPLLVLLSNGAQVSVWIYGGREDEIAGMLVESKVRCGLARDGSNHSMNSVRLSFPVGLQAQESRIDIICENIRGMTLAFDDMGESVFREPKRLSSFLKLADDVRERTSSRVDRSEPVFRRISQRSQAIR